MTTDALDRKIQQMHHALGELRSDDVSSISVERRSNYMGIDFSQGTTPSGLANIASGIIANIACLKDHLKVWCHRNGKTHDYEKLINTNKDVALIHDLWNIDKHGELNRPPRSGVPPGSSGSAPDRALGRPSTRCWRAALAAPLHPASARLVHRSRSGPR